MGAGNRGRERLVNKGKEILLRGGLLDLWIILNESFSFKTSEEVQLK